MIHNKQEGQCYRIGLNITLLRNSLALAWAWYDAPSYSMSVRRARLRWGKPGWKFFHETRRWHVVHNYLLMNGKVMITQEVAEDYLPLPVLVKLTPDDPVEPKRAA